VWSLLNIPSDVRLDTCSWCIQHVYGQVSSLLKFFLLNDSIILFKSVSCNKKLMISFFRRQKERERERGSMNWFEKDSRVSLLKASVMIDSSRQLLLSTINLNFLLAFQILNPCDCKKNLMNLLQCCCSTHSHTCRYPCQYLLKTRV
jgi:hypothetical protein